MGSVRVYKGIYFSFKYSKKSKNIKLNLHIIKFLLKS